MKKFLTLVLVLIYFIVNAQKEPHVNHFHNDSNSSR